MRLQQFRLGMAGESASILIRLLLSLRRHYRGRDLKRFPRVHVAGLTPIDYVGLGHVDLHNFRVPLVRLLFQAIDLGRREVHHVIGNKVRHLGAGFGDRFEHVAQFGAQSSSLILE